MGTGKLLCLVIHLKIFITVLNINVYRKPMLILITCMVYTLRMHAVPDLSHY